MAYNLFPAFAFLSADYRLAANLEKLKLKFCEGDQVRIECATVETEILITIKIDDEKNIRHFLLLLMANSNIKYQIVSLQNYANPSLIIK